MSEPVCRNCWLDTLSEPERSRMLAEPITACVYLCPEHQAAYDRLLAIPIDALIDHNAATRRLRAEPVIRRVRDLDDVARSRLPADTDTRRGQ